jgi:hypothetical protein
MVYPTEALEGSFESKWEGEFFSSTIHMSKMPNSRIFYDFSQKPKIVLEF